MFLLSSFFFFFNDTATTEIYTLSLHDALPISPGRGGRARLPARRKRLGQVDDAEDDPGDRAAPERASRLRRRGRHAALDEPPDRVRDGDRAGEPAALRADDGAREPRDGRVPPRRRFQGGLRACLHALPVAPRAPEPAGGDALGRRAADGGDGARADVPAEADADGRAVDGARADPRRTELRHHQAGTRGGRRRARRRAERERLALDRRPRLRAVDRAARTGGQGGRSARERGAAEGLPWPLSRPKSGRFAPMTTSAGESVASLR